MPTGAGSHYFPLMKMYNLKQRSRSLMPILLGSVPTRFISATTTATAQCPIIRLYGAYQHDRWHALSGQAGVERVFNDMLSGKDGEVMVMRDAKTTALKKSNKSNLKSLARILQLTVDSRLQYILYQELEKSGVCSKRAGQRV